MRQNMTLSNAQFSDYKIIIQQHSLQELFSSNLLRIVEVDSLQSFYAPFDAINLHAKIVLVGIAPGQLQWRNAVTACKDALQMVHLVVHFGKTLLKFWIMLVCMKNFALQRPLSFFYSNSIWYNTAHYSGSVY